MRKIPDELRDEMANDPFYKSCCLSHLPPCRGKIEWHHNLIYASKQVNEKWCILPLCELHHDMANDKYIRERLDHIMLKRATTEQLSPFCKAINWINRKETLIKIYG